jgi:uncharacterized protein YxeA
MKKILITLCLLIGCACLVFLIFKPSHNKKTNEGLKINYSEERNNNTAEVILPENRKLISVTFAGERENLYCLTKPMTIKDTAEIYYLEPRLTITYLFRYTIKETKTLK